ncbi:hypothetical protein CSA37_00045 [Candidatus Fermentibacteria bacterium]|nr:MAG: hypothetical protein CSA37_00045 [Candidatus Fermentibacteria bacterium]
MSASSDRDTLHLLAIFHYVMAGLIALFACIPLIHMTVGIALIFGGITENDPGVGLAGGFFAVIAGVIILFGLGFAFLIFYAGRNLDRLQKYQMCMVGAVLLCFFMPFGTILGIFTVITLNNESVKKLFAENDSQAEVSVEIETT